MPTVKAFLHNGRWKYICPVCGQEKTSILTLAPGQECTEFCGGYMFKVLAEDYYVSTSGSGYFSKP